MCAQGPGTLRTRFASASRRSRGRDSLATSPLQLKFFAHFKTRRRGSVVVDPVSAMPAVNIPLEGVRSHPTQAPPSTPVQPPPQRRCGVADPDTGLLIPCFNRGTNGAH